MFVPPLVLNWDMSKHIPPKVFNAPGKINTYTYSNHNIFACVIPTITKFLPVVHHPVMYTRSKT